MTGIVSPTDQELEDLLAFRDTLRRFLRWSSERARDVGLTPAQHQLLLAVRGHRSTRPSATSPPTCCCATTVRSS